MDAVGALARLLDEQAPDLRGRPLRQLAGGLDNLVVRIGDDLVARLPRHEDGARLAAHEQRWLADATRALPVEVPAVVVRGRPARHFPWPWSVCRWVPGETALRAGPDDRSTVDVLAELLPALWRPAPAGAPGNPWRGVPLAAREQLHRAALVELGHPDADRLVAELHALAAVPPWQGPPVWVHGDLHPGNVVVRDGRLVGVIDWGDVHAGDPAVDLAAAWMLLGAPGLGELRERLALDADTWERGRGWALVLAVMFLRYGRTDGVPDYTALGERTLRRARG